MLKTYLSLSLTSPPQIHQSANSTGFISEYLALLFVSLCIRSITTILVQVQALIITLELLQFVSLILSLMPQNTSSIYCHCDLFKMQIQSSFFFQGIHVLAIL